MCAVAPAFGGRDGWAWRRARRLGLRRRNRRCELATAQSVKFHSDETAVEARAPDELTHRTPLFLLNNDRGLSDGRLRLSPPSGDGLEVARGNAQTRPVRLEWHPKSPCTLLETNMTDNRRPSRRRCERSEPRGRRPASVCLSSKALPSTNVGRRPLPGRIAPGQALHCRNAKFPYVEGLHLASELAPSIAREFEVLALGSDCLW